VNNILISLCFGFIFGVITVATAAEEYCYAPYGGPVVAEFEADQALVKIIWLEGKRGMRAEASYYFDEESGTTLCIIWVRRPDEVLSDPDMDSLGHEVLHCLIGTFHDE